MEAQYKMNNLKENENFIHNKYGYCYYCICENCSLIHTLYVEEEHRRKGHAKDLIKFVIDEIRKAGYNKEIKIQAQPKENSISIENLVTFYESMGLKVLIKNNVCALNTEDKIE